MTNGFVVVATGDEIYKTCAEVLTNSIYNKMPHAKVSLITDNTSDIASIYDHVIKIDNVDDSSWKLANDWQVYWNSPYDRTIKIESDIYITRNVDYWWDVLKDRDINIATTIRDYRGNVSSSDVYRQTFRKSNLLDTYNGLTYFKKSEFSEKFFALVRDIFENWQEYSTLLSYSAEDRPTTDVAYALAAEIVGRDRCHLPNFDEFSFVHLKPQINDCGKYKWYQAMTHEINEQVFRINTIPQMYPVHYYEKEFSTMIQQELQNV